MAIPSVDSSSSNRFLRLGSIPLVDIRFLTQSELNSLSLCSEDAFDLRSSDDTIVPKIDRSIFNESAGSRKQTYSRILLAPHASDLGRRRRRRTGLLPVPRPASDSVEDSERKDNKQIIFFLHQLFLQRKKNSGEPCSVVWRERSEVDDGMQQNLNTAIVVYDRGNGNGILNRDGVAVDVAALANLEDPFGPELRRRTEGLKTEVELLGFLNGLEGRWGSRRKKRRIVDAADFGDDLPVGWKLLLAIRRKEGHFWLYCRRYISPSGQHFETCKEVSSYLLPYVTLQEPVQTNSAQINESTPGNCNMASGNNPGPAHEDEISRDIPICYSAVPISSISPDHERQVLLRVENPAKTLLRDLLGCSKCNLTFSDKDACVQHLLTFHKRSAKRCRLGKSIGDGVIIRDGKYECQFCHKIFDERRRYNSHVGVHVRDYEKSLAALPDEIIVQTSIDSPSLAGMPVAVPEMDAAVEMDNDEDSIPTTPMDKSDDELNVRPPHIKQEPENSEGVESPSGLNTTCEPMPIKVVDEKCNSSMMTDDKVGMIVEPNNSGDDKFNACSDAAILLASEERSVTCDTYDRMDAKFNACSDSATHLACEEKSVTCDAYNSVDDKLNAFSDAVTHLAIEEKGVTCDAYEKNLFPSSMDDEINKFGQEQENIFETCSVTQPYSEQNHSIETCADDILTNSANVTVLDELEKCGDDQENSFGIRHHGSSKNAEMGTTRSASEEKAPQGDVVNLPSSSCFPSIEVVSDKGEDEFGGVSQLENISSLKDLEMDDIDPQKFSFMLGPDSSTLPEEPMDLEYSAELEQGLDPSIQFDWGPALRDMVSRRQLTTICVWCRTEFSLEGFNPETQSDSVGFMCPSCKAKISGQLNVLDNGIMKSD